MHQFLTIDLSKPEQLAIKNIQISTKIEYTR